MSRISIAILGSTGSIGRQTLDVARRHPDRIEVCALSAHSNIDLLLKQAAEFGVRRIAIADAERSQELAALAPDCRTSAGPSAVAALAGVPEADVVVNALVGAAGLGATVTALESRKRLALANKESLVVGGDLVMRLASRGSLLPVDSEHSAIFQCLLGEPREAVSSIWLTASGGPFRGWTRDALAQVTAEQALAHPTWNMGPKITVDSSTLMNKGLEVIEAHHLFGIPYDDIRVVVHPQSCVHSMVEFTDGSVKAHLGVTDMRVPIQYALSHPERWPAPVPPLDFVDAKPTLEFDGYDPTAFRCLSLAIEAGRRGGTLPAAMNAANEVAVAAFLEGRCGFLDIERVVEGVMNAHDTSPLESIEHAEQVDLISRRIAMEIL